jgi:hypothetical protein
LQRYEDQDPEDYDAILTKDFDKFDMILQAEYSSFNWFFIGYKDFYSLTSGLPLNDSPGRIFFLQLFFIDYKGLK